MLQLLNGLELAGSWGMSVATCSKRHGLKTYNRLVYSSIPLLTAVANKTIIQMLVKLGLRQSEFGISAGRLCFTWLFIHQMNAGTEATLMTSSEMLVACLMFLISEESILPLSALVIRPTTAETHANTYDSVAIPALRTIVPTQSISEASCFRIVRPDLG